MISCIVVDEPGLMAYKNKGTNIKIIFLLFFKKKSNFLFKQIIKNLWKIIPIFVNFSKFK
jgi:hypothetical protein